MMDCVKCGKCCTRCRIVRDSLISELATELILMADICNDVDEFVTELKKRVDMATERNVRRIKNESRFML